MMVKREQRKALIMDINKTNMLIAYFSHTGENYSNGKIVDLDQGNTAVAAEMVAALTGAELFEIRTVKDYPFIYNECTDVAKQELRAGSRPELAETIDVSGYDTIILGYPNWWGTMPMAVCTFLESQSFAGKTILPFCTHEGSGMGNSERDLKKLCPDARICAGLPIHGSSVSSAGAAVKQWLQQNPR